MNDESMNIVILGHVDHGKSTLVGRLMAETGCVPEAKIQAVRQYCEKNSKPFEYAFLVDALHSERAQGITIDIARCFFKSSKRRYLLLDAPGHLEFLKNMVTGASRAEAALILLDAQAGIQENTKRHGRLAAMLGVRRLILIVNKMDLFQFQPARFHQLVSEYRNYLKTLGLDLHGAIPTSAVSGQGLVEPSAQMSWYHGPSVLQALDSLEKLRAPVELPFRMYLQDVYPPTITGKPHHILVGRPESGTLRDGDDIVFLPSGKQARVAKIVIPGDENVDTLGAGVSGGLTLTQERSVFRGELICRKDEVPAEVVTRIRASLFWMGNRPLEIGQSYTLKMGTIQLQCQVGTIFHILSAQADSPVQAAREVRKNESAELILELQKPLAVDFSWPNLTTSRFVIVDQYEICGGGLILQEVSANNKSKTSGSFIWRRIRNFFGSKSWLDF